jgi:hypothetical protein
MKKYLTELKQKANEYNIRSGIQLQFFFELMHVYRLYGILFGPDTTNGKNPVKTNPSLTPYLSKHEYYIVTQILPRLFNNPEINKRFKNNEEFNLRELQKEIKIKQKELEKQQQKIDEENKEKESSIEIDTSIDDML